MRMLEESACIAASRFYNHHPHFNNNCQVKVLTARVESITFQQPLHAGDFARVDAKVIFASEHTVAVAVKLSAERLTCKEEAVSNRALLWIVGHMEDRSQDSTRDPKGIATVQRTVDPNRFFHARAPTLEQPTDKEDLMMYKLAAMAYKKRKAHQYRDLPSLPGSEILNDDNCDTTDNVSGDAFTPEQSAVELAHVMLPADCATGNGLVGGGVIMKLVELQLCATAAPML